jgi:hypothetical protein
MLEVLARGVAEGRNDKDAVTAYPGGGEAVGDEAY